MNRKRLMLPGSGFLAMVSGNVQAVTIGKGSKQLIRLIKQGDVPVGVEQAYRIIVDEITPPAGNYSDTLVVDVAF